MQVKKFEAKTMKEALELVKTDLGPEAIILSAKDAHRGFGLLGDRSVEVTAAVSEETLRKKRVYDSKLREEQRSKFNQIPAFRQKEFINRVFDGQGGSKETPAAVATYTRAKTADPAARLAPPASRPSPSRTGTRYIDIPEEDLSGGASVGAERVRRAVLQARAAGQNVLERPQAATPPTVIESQLLELKSLFERFQSVPQVSMTMHPGAENGISFELSQHFRRLVDQGLDASMVTTLLRRAQSELQAESLKNPNLVEAWIVSQLLQKTVVNTVPTAGRYHVFVGATAQGKSTTLVKFAAHLLLKEKKTIAIISIDTLKVGAADQMRIYAQILNVPFAIVRKPEEWAVAQKRLASIDCVLVDVPGLNLVSAGESEWLRHMLPPASFDVRLHFVQSVLARDAEVMELANRYMPFRLNDVIFTRMDESSRQGIIANFQERLKLPLHSFGWGARIPEDYEFATQERVIDLLFKPSKFPNVGG